MTTHATKRAIAVVAGLPVGELPEDARACDGRRSVPLGRSPVRVFTRGDAIELARSDERPRTWPDCPKCLVLLDGALEARHAKATT